MLRFYQVAMNMIPNASSVLFRKRVFMESGGAVEDMRLAGDWMTWSRMLLRADVAFTAETLNSFRVHDKTVRSDWLTHQTFALEYASVIRFVCRSVDVPRGARELALAKLRARWRRVSRGLTVGGILTLCAAVRAVGGAAAVPRFLAPGLAGIARGSVLLRPFYMALKRIRPEPPHDANCAS